MLSAPDPEAGATGSVARPFARGLTALLGGRSIALGLQFVAFALLVAHLGPHRFGLYAFAVALAEIFGLVANFGFRIAATREVAQHPERERELVPNLFYLRLGLGVVAYLLLLGTVAVVGYGGDAREAAFVAGTMLALTAAESFLTSLEVRLRMGWAAFADAAKAAFFLGGVLVLLHADAGLLAFLWLYVASNALAFVIVFVQALRLASFDWRPRRKLAVPLIMSSSSLGVATLLITLYYRLDVVVLARIQPPSDVGQYGAAFKFVEVFLLLPALTMSVLAPVLARSFVESHATFRRRYGRALQLVTVIALPVAVAGAMTAARALPAIPGFDAYDGAGVALAILAPAAAAAFMSSIVQGALIAAHLERRLLIVSALGLVANVVLVASLIPTLSYVGAAVASTATAVIVLALSVRETRSRLGLTWPMPNPRAVAVATAALAAALVPGYFVHPFAQLGIGAVVYAVALSLAGGVVAADLALFLGERRTPRPSG
jgi:O-antigen/teichoic acid export membrane protein